MKLKHLEMTCPMTAFWVTGTFSFPGGVLMQQWSQPTLQTAYLETLKSLERARKRQAEGCVVPLVFCHAPILWHGQVIQNLSTRFTVKVMCFRYRHQHPLVWHKSDSSSVKKGTPYSVSRVVALIRSSSGQVFSQSVFNSNWIKCVKFRPQA